jgi:hypothetical protein
MSTENGLRCPHCGEGFSSEMIAAVKDESRIAMAITPAPGELFDVETIGDVLKNYGKLLRAVGKEMEVKTLVMLERVEAGGDGKLELLADPTPSAGSDGKEGAR